MFNWKKWRWKWKILYLWHQLASDMTQASVMQGWPVLRQSASGLVSGCKCDLANHEVSSQQPWSDQRFTEVYSQYLYLQPDADDLDCIYFVGIIQTFWWNSWYDCFSLIESIDTISASAGKRNTRRQYVQHSRGSFPKLNVLDFNFGRSPLDLMNTEQTVFDPCHFHY